MTILILVIEFTERSLALKGGLLSGTFGLIFKEYFERQNGFVLNSISILGFVDFSCLDC